VTRRGKTSRNGVEEDRQVPDKEKPRDWDKELAEVDRLLAKLPHADPTLGRGGPAAPKPGTPGAPHALAPGAVAATPPPGATVVWIRVGLGLLAGLAMTQWPYSHACGLKEMFYLVGAGAVVAAAVWGAWGSWRRRMGLAHGLSIGLLIWGLALVTFEVLPRIGYAATTATWFCPEPPVTP
jgi:hypothetical protein